MGFPSSPLGPFPMPSLACLFLVAACQTSDPSPTEQVHYAVVVNTENETSGLSSARLRRILRREIQEWQKGKTVELLLPRSGSSEKQVLLERVYDMTDLQLKRYWTRMIYENRIVEAPTSVPSTTVAVSLLERISGSVTIVPASAVTNDARFRVLHIDKKLPGDTGYPLWGPKTKSTDANKGSVRDAAATAEAAASMDGGDEQDEGEESDLEARLSAIEDRLAWEDADSNGLPSLNLRLFGHLEAEWEKETIDSESDTSNAFSLEVVDLLFTSALTERTSALAEVVVEALDDNDYDIEVERLLLKYRASDAANVQFGRYLTSLGYWNTKYNHAEWLQTSIDRPEILSFEDDGGFLPIHNVGLRLNGGFYNAAGWTEYTFEVANGRGTTPDQVQIKEDENNRKAVNFQLAMSPDAVPGLVFGGGLYLDDIPPNDDPGDGAVHGHIDETIYNVFAAYEDFDWEIMGEYFLIDHDQGATTAESSGWYFQVGRRSGKWTPYVRIDSADLDDQATFYEDTNDTWSQAYGVRYDMNLWSALTLQYEQQRIDVPDGEPNEKTDTVVFQVSFVL